MVKAVKNKINTQTNKEMIENYMLIITNKCNETIELTNIKNKINHNNFSILKYYEYPLLMSNNYNLQQLKDMNKEYKLKVTGNKTELTKRLYTYLKLSNSIIKIQKIARGYILNKYIKLHGPAFYDRMICNNNSDFLSMEPIEEIPYTQFFSFQDIDGFTYAFDILSFYNLLMKSENTELANPYNRKVLQKSVVQDFKSLLRLSKLLKIDIITNLKDIHEDITPKQSLDVRIVSLFQNIDALGNYSNISWFNSLTRVKLLTFVRELADIWDYRANISQETKRAICPPNGNPFGHMYYVNLLQIQDINELKENIINVLEKIVNNGIDQGSKSLGAYYVLSALTLVSADAAVALPWLYDAVIY